MDITIDLTPTRDSHNSTPRPIKTGLTEDTVTLILSDRELAFDVDDIEQLLSMVRCLK